MTALRAFSWRTRPFVALLFPDASAGRRLKSLDFKGRSVAHLVRRLETASAYGLWCCLGEMTETRIQAFRFRTAQWRPATWLVTTIRKEPILRHFGAVFLQFGRGDLQMRVGQPQKSSDSDVLLRRPSDFGRLASIVPFAGSVSSSRALCGDVQIKDYAYGFAENVCAGWRSCLGVCRIAAQCSGRDADGFLVGFQRRKTGRVHRPAVSGAM